jgi:hypothetical protein
MYEGLYKYADGTNVYGSDPVPPPDIGFERTGFQTLIEHVMADVSRLEWPEGEEEEVE